MARATRPATRCGRAGAAARASVLQGPARSIARRGCRSRRRARRARARASARAAPSRCVRLCTSTAIDCSRSSISLLAENFYYPRYLGAGRVAHRVRANELVASSGARRAAGAKRRAPGFDAVLGRKNLCEGGVHPFDDCGGAAEIALQREAPQPDGADAALLRQQEQRHVRIAKPIDRLHRIADEKQACARHRVANPPSTAPANGAEIARCPGTRRRAGAGCGDRAQATTPKAHRLDRARVAPRVKARRSRRRAARRTRP